MGDMNKDPEAEVEFETEIDADHDRADDIEIEETDTNTTQKIKKLRESLKTCEQEKMTHHENLQRAKAEFLNTKKRLQEQLKIEKERITSNHIEKLLPLCDSFHMAMHDQEKWNAIDDTWRKGVESIYSQLQALLAGEGVSAVDPTGKPFDPAEHEAMGNTPVTETKLHDTVVTVIQQGYVRQTADSQILLRPARVITGEYSE